ncbi:hypothetical protein G7067_06520 [Leucobacter insecticola]|uniref:YceI family protein n=1 Tax=Leucobacter insecticola TaxID=2714934 RepID=A0A6G8FIM7_9MICO|nr:hypothetical protein [Leucobacter insecticola]QIM16153.1 hypothetical protein G7067_06520 [Leucobacter insecticola]
MSRIHATRTARSFGVFATLSIALPFCISSCSAISDAETPAVELRADSSSDLLAVQPDQFYQVSEVEILSPVHTNQLGDDVETQVSPSGFMVMHDGVITQAELSISVAGLPEASFVLTEPVILRRETRTEGVVTAVGTFSVDGFQQRGATITLASSVITDRAAEFDITFKVPSSLLSYVGRANVNEVSAHIELTAE